jgi:hypothetical protein
MGNVEELSYEDRQALPPVIGILLQTSGGAAPGTLFTLNHRIKAKRERKDI